MVGGGGGGIRTHDRIAPILVFKTSALSRSATPPYSLLCPSPASSARLAVGQAGRCSSKCSGFMRDPRQARSHPPSCPRRRASKAPSPLAGEGWDEGCQKPASHQDRTVTCYGHGLRILVTCQSMGNTPSMDGRVLASFGGRSSSRRGVRGSSVYKPRNFY